jgi:hypothetical protein
VTTSELEICPDLVQTLRRELAAMDRIDTLQQTRARLPDICREGSPIPTRRALERRFFAGRVRLDYVRKKFQ